MQALKELESLFRAAKSEDRLDEFFHHNASTAIDAIACESEALTLALLLWLPDDNVSELALALCHAVSVHYLQVKVAAAFELTGSDSGRAEAVALRLIANNVAPAVSIGWLLSLAATHGKGAGTMALVNELMGYHVGELPLSTEELLSNKKNPLVNLDVSNHALEYLREFREHLTGLPQLRELHMPVHMRLMYASMRRERSRAINAGSEKRSIFSSMFRTQRFKYSTRTAVEIHSGSRIEEQTLTMAPFSLFMELPVSEMTDPFAAHFQRQGFSKRGRG